MEYVFNICFKYEGTHPVILVAFDTLVEEPNQQIGKSAADGACDNAADNVGGEMHHEIIAAGAHNYNVHGRGEEYPPLAVFVVSETQTHSACHSGGCVA